jgi:hypothetical protein
MKKPENYKVLLKAFGSKNGKVLTLLYKIMTELGDIQDRADEYLESLASAALVKTYKTSSDFTLKQETIKFITLLCDSNRTTAVEMAKYGAV